MWIVMFRKLDVKLLYSIAYHSQTNDQFERTNQTMKIVLRFYFERMQNSFEWSNVFLKIQRHLNNVINVIIDKTLNETTYDFTSI